MRNQAANGRRKALVLRREERLQIMLSPEEWAALDNYRFRHRMPSRAAAVRELLRLGLASHGVPVASAGEKSQNFGVLKRPNGNGQDPL
jgi:hypothetical protein